MQHIAQNKQVTGGEPAFLRVIVIAVFIMGMASGLLLAIAWDAAFSGQRRPLIETDIVLKEHASRESRLSN